MKEGCKQWKWKKMFKKQIANWFQLKTILIFRGAFSIFLLTYIVNEEVFRCLFFFLNLDEANDTIAGNCDGKHLEWFEKLENIGN